MFVNNGVYSPFRDRRHGTPATEFLGDRFVAFVQNHDQIGNRMRSDRYAASLSPAATRLAAGLLLLAPRLPLLFMGEEYGETNPFPFFCDFQDPALRDVVRKGRAEEFAHFGWKDEPPDPTDPATRDSAVLSWRWDDPVRAGLRHLYRTLLTLRRSTPALLDFHHARPRLLHDSRVLEITRGAPSSDSPLRILFNLTDSPAPLDGTPRFRSEVQEFGADGSGDARMLRPREFAIMD